MSGKWPLAADGLPQPITVRCPTCGVRSNVWCSGLSSGYHVERIRATPGRSPADTQGGKEGG